MPRRHILSPRTRWAAFLAATVLLAIAVRPDAAFAGGRITGTVPGPGGLALVV